jgi:D-sedoheptulose 7-phosphate isomerase
MIRYFNEVRAALDVAGASVGRFIEALYAAHVRGSTVFIVGNGGSASNASHLAEDLAQGTLPHVRSKIRFRAVALTDNVSFITALANDVGYEAVFEQQLRTFARPHDLLVAISCSGNSPNVVRAIEWANRNELRTFAVTGLTGGVLNKIAQGVLHVPSADIGLCEAAHSTVFHFATTQLKTLLARDAGDEHIDPA